MEACSSHDLPDLVSFHAKSKAKHVRFSNHQEEIGDYADSKAKPRKNRKVPLENHFDDCGADDAPLHEADDFTESFLSFDIHNQDVHDYQLNNNCSYHVPKFEDTVRILNYFQDHKREQLDALQLFGGLGNIIKLGFRRGLKGMNIDLQTGMDLNNTHHLQLFWKYMRDFQP